jgi:hypothetical protein
VWVFAVLVANIMDLNNGGEMSTEWNELTKITRGQPITIERIRLNDSGIAIEGDFTLPPLAGLRWEDQVFVVAFIHCHGSIKEMEQMFGISYPTVKNRLNRIAGQLQFLEVIKIPPTEEVIDELESGQISTEEAIRRLSE